MHIPPIQQDRLSEVAEILKRFYEHILKESGVKLRDLPRFSAIAEKAQLYP